MKKKIIKCLSKASKVKINHKKVAQRTHTSISPFKLVSYDTNFNEKFNSKFKVAII